jgi:hypothetical protein
MVEELNNSSILITLQLSVQTRFDSIGNKTIDEFLAVIIIAQRRNCMANPEKQRVNKG